MHLSLPKSLKLLPLALVAITIVILLIDLYDEKVAYQNGLAFQIHVYSYGSTFVLATFVSYLYLRGSKHMDHFLACCLGAVIAAAWWALTFVILFYFHGLIGGRY